MSKNFDPGFDREKAAFIALANRGDGLTPIKYLYAKEANFDSVLASYYKGGVIDVNMLYAVNIEAISIVTKTIEAKIATIDTTYINTAYITTLYSKNIHNKEKIDTADLFVSDDLTVGSKSLLATIDFYPSLFAVVGKRTSFELEESIKIDTPEMIITGYPQESFAKIKIDSNDFEILSKSSAKLIFQNVEDGDKEGDKTKFELTNLNSCTISTTTDTKISVTTSGIGLKATNEINLEVVNGSTTVNSDLNSTKAISAVQSVSAGSYIKFGNITFESNGKGTYTWPSPPLSTPIPFVDMNYLDCELISGELVWKTQSLETEILIPQTLQYLTCIDGILKWSFVVLPASEDTVVPGIIISVPNHLSCISKTGELVWMTSNIFVIGNLPPAGVNGSKIEIGKSIIIDAKEYEIPPFPDDLIPSKK